MKLTVFKVSVDVVYALLSSAAVSVANGISTKEPLFLCKRACSVGQHPAFKITAMYSVVSCASGSFFWCSNRAYFVISLTAYCCKLHLLDSCQPSIAGIFFGRKCFFFTFTASSLHHWICAVFLISHYRILA